MGHGPWLQFVVFVAFIVDIASHSACLHLRVCATLYVYYHMMLSLSVSRAANRPWSYARDLQMPQHRDREYTYTSILHSNIVACNAFCICHAAHRVAIHITRFSDIIDILYTT